MKKPEPSELSTHRNAIKIELTGIEGTGKIEAIARIDVALGSAGYQVSMPDFTKESIIIYAKHPKNA